MENISNFTNDELRSKFAESKRLFNAATDNDTRNKLNDDLAALMTEAMKRNIIDLNA